MAAHHPGRLANNLQRNRQVAGIGCAARRRLTREGGTRTTAPGQSFGKGLKAPIDDPDTALSGTTQLCLVCVCVCLCLCLCVALSDCFCVSASLCLCVSVSLTLSVTYGYIGCSGGVYSPGSLDGFSVALRMAPFTYVLIPAEDDEPMREISMEEPDDLEKNIGCLTGALQAYYRQHAGVSTEEGKAAIVDSVKAKIAEKQPDAAPLDAGMLEQLAESQTVDIVLLLPGEA